MPRLYVSQWGDSYDSARILLPDFLHRLSLNGDPIVFVPNRGQLRVTGEYDRTGMSLILKHGVEEHFRHGYSLSPNLYIHRDGQWEIFLLEEDELRTPAISVRRRGDAIDYEQQKGCLEKKFARENLDVFVASCQILKRRDGSIFSRCVWSPAEALLPVADYVVSTSEVKSKDLVTVKWEEVVSTVSELMLREPDLYPPRYHVRAFPSAEQLSRLREASEGAAGPERS